MVSRFSGRDVISKPTCPFCGIRLDRPKERMTEMPTEMPLGTCSCGAVFACDVTGHNLGTAMIEALVFACHGDWDFAWNLSSENDYLEDQVKNYDLETHLIVHGGVYEGRRIAGTLYFIRLQENIRELAEKGADKQPAKATPDSGGRPSKKSGRKSFTKKDVERLVEDYQIEPLLDMAREDKRIVRNLKRLLYSVDKLLRWRAAEALGKVSAVIAQNDPGTVSKLLQGLFTSVTDTAASSWGSLDAIGEIVSSRPEQFAGYMPQLYQLTRDRALLAEVLRALGKIGSERPDLIRKETLYFIPLLQDPDPEIRGYTVILLGCLGAHEATDDLRRLMEDSAGLEVYRDGHLEKQTIGQLASEALEKL